MLEFLSRLFRKNLDANEALADIGSFSALEGEAGEKILQHLAIKYKVFETVREKSQFQAGFDEGARSVVMYLAQARHDYGNMKRDIERKINDRTNPQPADRAVYGRTAPRSGEPGTVTIPVSGPRAD